MAVGLASKTAFVVRDSNEQVVMIVWGDDARDAALDWIGRGYRVQRIDPSDVVEQGHPPVDGRLGVHRCTGSLAQSLHELGRNARSRLGRTAADAKRPHDPTLVERMRDLFEPPLTLLLGASRQRLAQLAGEKIGRASCRERAEDAASAVSVENNLL